MKIRGTQASSWRSLAIFLREFNQADDRLPRTNVTPEFSSSSISLFLSLFLSSTVKPMNQRVNTGLSPRKLQLQEGKQSRHSSGPSSDSSLALQNIIFILKLQCRTFHLCDILFSAIHYSSSIICEPATGIPQLPLAERRIRAIRRQLSFCLMLQRGTPRKVQM